ncbi:SKP1-like protein 11 [Oryza brachyantha]|uniref:SKP1-like protein n=1 Tax=Oryza brachyantha TaxID=4533 RepID=J3MN47_ORYBR|nr:SKP1-like protein 11 [Oryza brachyantha]
MALGNREAAGEKLVPEALEKAAPEAAVEGADEREEKGSDRMIHLKSNDGRPYDVSEAAARMSKFIAKMIDDNCADPYIPLYNVDYKTLALLMRYCDKHTADTADEEGLKAWDKDFINGLDKDSIFKVIMASNYLYIDVLLDLACKKIADMIRGKTPEEIREAFNIRNDLTEEEEKEIRQEHAWAFV